MRLLELEPHFIRRDGETWDYLDTKAIETADGIEFLCPACFVTNAGDIGTHVIVCWRPRVPAGVSPGPGRWEFLGRDLSDLSLTAGQSSVKLGAGCHAHFFIKNGNIEFSGAPPKPPEVKP